MKEEFLRTELLVGEEAVLNLKNKTVIIFGLGGVGSFAVEALARSGVGKLVLVDNDKINLSNINRQLFALHSTVGMLKTDAAKARIKDIDESIIVETHSIFFDEKTISQIDFKNVDYIVDCIDSIKSKILLISTAKSLNKSIISCLGTGNKLDNTAFKVADIYSTNVCPLAKLLRHELRNLGIDSLKVVYSEEAPQKPVSNKIIPSISFVPPVAGMIIAGVVIKDLIGEKNG